MSFLVSIVPASDPAVPALVLVRSPNGETSPTVKLVATVSPAV